jgi:hypothetical protein
VFVRLWAKATEAMPIARIIIATVGAAFGYFIHMRMREQHTRLLPSHLQ